MPKSIRIRTEVGVDKYINLDLEQDFELIEILSLKILTNDLYTRYCSDYGVIVGRVSVNNGYGVPNARVSVFIPLQGEDVNNPVIAELYPYVNLSSRNEQGYRYNLLPEEPSYIGHQATGTFPTRDDVLMNSSYVEVYDRYYRFTVKTNESGDFMIFGVPIGEQTVVMDVDLSDIGCFSLSPQDLIQEGVATESQVDSAQFKTSTNLDSLPQIVNLNFNVDVRPLWGDLDLCQLGITRLDFDLTKFANIVIKPYAVFMGSLVSTTDDDSLSIACRPKNDTGNFCELIAGPGQILAIRQTIFSDQTGKPVLEEYVFENDGKIIDNNGTFVASVPMNLDYIVTNEFGDQIISNDPSKGIPTKGKYRFKFRWINKEKTLSLNRFQQQIGQLKKEVGLSDDEYSGQYQRASFLVPNIKEYGWQNSGVDPLTLQSQTVTYSIPSPPPIQPPYPAQTGPTIVIPNSVGWQFVLATNNISYEIWIDTGSGFQPYFGGVESIFLPAGSQVYIVGTPLSINPQTFTFNEIPQDKFNLYRSYAFSLDWDDYADFQSAIDCEDTFYQFNYNKVYTTALFLDRYKNGLGRAKHLGIKEIDNRTCKTENNTFPVNDIIRNFDLIFFVFNLLMIIILPLAILILFLAHFLAWLWPYIKAVIVLLYIFLVGYQGYQAYLAYQDYSECQQSAIGIGAVNPALGASMTAACLQLFLAALGQAAFMIAVVTAFGLFLLDAIRRITFFPRIPLPMINYPDCAACECQCGTAELDDNFNIQSVQGDINSAAEVASQTLSNPTNIQLTISAGFLAPVGISGSYTSTHPNYYQNPQGSTNVNDGPFYCGFPLSDFQSIEYSLQQGTIDGNVAARASQDYLRLFSGYDILSSSNTIKMTINEKDLIHAPQPFLFAANQTFGINPDRRWFAFPLSETYPQRLNQFNTRDKYFSGVNRIKTTVNPQIVGSQPFDDQVIVMLAKPEVSQQLTPGKVFTFQNPDYFDLNSPIRLVNLTGASFNDFGTNSITGVTFTGTTGITINYANPLVPNGSVVSTANIFLTANPVTQVVSLANNGPTTAGVNGYEQSYLRFPTDLEYFQAITGLTVTNFLNQASTFNSNLFPKGYLLHQIKYLRPNCGLVNPPGTNYFVETITTPALQLMQNFGNYEVIICTRGVDPHSQTQNIQYDLSTIFGNPSNTNVVAGPYYPNVPIQAYPPSIVTNTSENPITHYTPDNNGYDLYFPSLSFTVSPQSAINPNYTGFTSNLPYYYLSTDDDSIYVGNTFSQLYNPGGFNSFTTGFISQNMIWVNSNFGVPWNPVPPLPTTYFVGGSFIGTNHDQDSANLFSLNYFGYSTLPGSLNFTKTQYFWPPFSNTPLPFPRLNFLYSAAYYKVYLTSPVNFSQRNYHLMRSDRIPTSTKVQNGTAAESGYGLHQNDNFFYYGFEDEDASVYTTGGDIIDGSGLDTSNIITALTETLQCEGIVPLSCYSGDGYTWGIIPYSKCSVPANIVVNGCYCLLNEKDHPLGPPITKTILGIKFTIRKRKYLVYGAFQSDLALLYEWKVRFTMNFALCRGVFAQVFQNNWVNGVLYMFSFNTRKIFGFDPNQPLYNTQFYKSYCDDVIVYNDITNNFYYRSSPWNYVISEFIGKNPPSTNMYPASLLNLFPPGYNKKQIQFPTTVVDLGPRDSFIKEICSNPAFGSYYADQLDTTSYQDNSNILLLGFLSRLLNQEVSNTIQPSGSQNALKEGYSITQFFDNNRQSARIDGDIAQMLSINSEWKVSPFITENLDPATANDYIFFGTEIPGAPTKPVFGVFFSSSTQELRYRKIMSPGIETYSQTPLIQEVFGYPKSQEVPHYRWLISQSPWIFGTENNNWYTDVLTAGFFKKQYQDLNFFSLNEKYLTQYNQSQAGFGFITNFDGTVIPPLPEPKPAFPPAGTSGVIQGQPIGSPTQTTGKQQSFVVGAPYHFYFGLKNGATAIDKFYKLYVPEF